MIDEKATRTKVDKFLNKYHNIRRIAGQHFFLSLESAINTDIQQSKDDNLPKEVIERKNMCENILSDIHNTLSMIPNKDASLLFIIYMNDTKLTNDELSNSLNISKATVYRYKNNALLHFSESFRGGSLIVFKDEDN